jgi:hypothetical protein
MSFTKDQEQEVCRCATDFPYFCANYVKVLNWLPGGHSEIVPFSLHDYQERYYEHVESNRFTILSKFRQGGFTTLAAIYGLWRCLFRLDERVLFLAKSDREATEVCDGIVKRALTHLPDWMTGNVLKMTNSHQKTFPDTGSDMQFYAPKASCGKGCSLLIVDEAAFIKDMDQHWRCMYPILSCGGSCIVQSTASYTDTWFWGVLEDAKLKLNEWSVYDCHYAEKPAFADPEWQATMKGQLGDKGWQSEMEQVAQDPHQPEKAVLPAKKKVWRSIYDDWSGADEETTIP